MPDRVVALVLAAGAGSRFGGSKLLALLAGEPLLQHVLDRVAEAGLHEVVVVLGADADAIERTIAWRAERRIRNPEPERGLASSLQVGMETLDAGVDATLILLGDQPLVATEAICAILHAPIDPGRPIAVPIYAGDAGRNPVLLRRGAFELAREAAGDRGLGPLLGAHPELVHEVPVVGDNPDVDTPADLEALAGRTGGGG